ncbi:hypothetical protein SAMN05421690_10458 [Nitrosomonas sp. Nm51]|nr:hypothetical protein SAMN05421690_10458 [Nitrosomonas sp. Nm51]
MDLALSSCETGACQQVSIDRIMERLERIENRLDLRNET